MNCPNCSQTFRLVADYASHLRRCKPLEVHAAATEPLLAKLNAAAEAIDVELGVVEAEGAAQPQLVA